LKAHAKQIDILSPQAYVFNATGTISGSISSRTFAITNTNHIKVMPLIESAHSDINNNHALLINISAQNSLINSLITLANVHGFYGWQLDMEHASSSDRALFTAFAQRMGTALHAHGLEFSIAVVSKTSDNPADYDAITWNEWAGVFDYPALAQSADFLSVMAYDQPNSLGPVSSLPWFEQVTNYAESVVPKSKLSIGIPFYAWEWIPGNNKKLLSHTYQYALDLVKKNLIKAVVFNNTFGSDVMQYFLKVNGIKENRVLWYENIRSFTLKYDFLETSGVLGFSGWSLGQEDSRDWTLLLVQN
jgi:spore germination protein YaaH